MHHNNGKPQEGRAGGDVSIRLHRSTFEMLTEVKGQLTKERKRNVGLSDVVSTLLGMYWGSKKPPVHVGERAT